MLLLEKRHMKKSTIITSSKINNQKIKLDSEIQSIQRDLKRAEQSSRWLENWQPEQLADLQDKLKAKELEKGQLEQSILSGLTSVLALVNGRAQAYTICAETLIDLAYEFEGTMEDRGIPVKNRAGAEARYRPAGKSVAHSPMGRSITTYVVMRRVHDGWRLIRAERDYCYDNQREFMQVIVRPCAHENMIRHATRNFCVWDETPTDGLMA